MDVWIRLQSRDPWTLVKSRLSAERAFYLCSWTKLKLLLMHSGICWICSVVFNKNYGLAAISESSYSRKAQQALWAKKVDFSARKNIGKKLTSLYITKLDRLSLDTCCMYTLVKLDESVIESDEFIYKLIIFVLALSWGTVSLNTILAISFISLFSYLMYQMDEQVLLA